MLAATPHTPVSPLTPDINHVRASPTHTGLLRLRLREGLGMEAIRQTTSVTNAAMPVCVMSFSRGSNGVPKLEATHVTLPRPRPVRRWSQRVPVAGDRL